ncbi:hypothetical protein AV926_17160 [Myroides marinus]|uniref:SWIM-type domain-containing protein n=1 Tax=Myroides marinus TaxID=703342 RepID=A0A165QJ13_9FLAO|nr:hypothetical protein [Myroides marinus]KZE75224.1 hypothetical protein AV926_17160 [Myroides marinus]
MTITQILKQFDKASLTTISKLTIRELEEEKKGHWVAYVDEGNESYDVHVKFLGKQVDFTSCDCCVQEDQLCAHKTKMLLMLDDKLKGKKVVDKPVAKKILSKKKISESVALLHDVNQKDVYGWLEELFKKNKEVETEFLLKFGMSKANSYTVEEVDKILKDILVATMGRKRQEASAKQVKTLIDLFTIALAPVEDFLITNITKPIALDIYLAVVFRLFNFNHAVYHSSTRVGTFTKKFTERFLYALFNVKDKVAIEKQLALLRMNLQYQEGRLEYETYWYLFKFINDAIPEELLHKYIFEIIELKKFAEGEEEEYDSIQGISRFLLNVVNKNNVFKQYYKAFRPVQYDEEFNLLLIKLVIDIDLLYAEQLCQLIIDKHLHFFRNDGVEDMLTEIKQKLGKNDDVLKMRKKRFTESLNIDDYKFIIKSFKNKKEAGAFKEDIKSKLSKATLYSSELAKYFEILDFEKDYTEILNLLKVYPRFPLINEYFKQLYQADAKQLLDRIMMAGQSVNSIPSDAVLLASLSRFILENYTSNEILNKLMKYATNKNSMNLYLKQAIIANQK